MSWVCQATAKSSLALAFLLTVVATLVPVERASAKPPFRNLGDNTPFIEHAWVEFSHIEFDSQFTRVAATVICPVDDFGPDGGATEPCRARVGVTWFLEGKSIKGPKYGLAAPRDMVIERGATEGYDVRIPPQQLRNVLTRSGGQATLGIGSVEPRHAVPPVERGPGHPDLHPGEADPLEQLRGPDLPASHRRDPPRGDPRRRRERQLRAPLFTRHPDPHALQVKGRARFTLNGLRHEVSEGSEFSVWCVGLNALHRGKTFPALQLDRGTVRVSGRPATKRQFAAVVTTQEGFLGSRSDERLAMTVTRSEGRRQSTLMMHRGRTGTITPLLQGLGGSPCTAGKALSVNWRGVIRPV